MNALILLLALAADPAAPEATAAAPRAVIGGDETVIVGQMAELTATDSENAKSFKWIVRPKPLSMKLVGDKGSSIYISHDQPEAFEVELIVASASGDLDVQIGMLEVRGAGGTGGAAGVPAAGDVPQAAVAIVGPAAAPSLTVAELTAGMRQLKELQEILNPAPQPVGMISPGMISPGMSTLAMMGHPPARPDNAVTWPQGVKILAERVASNTRSAEGKIVGGSFRSVANRIKVGTFSGGDPWEEAYRQSREALGQAYTPWAKFFVDLSQLVGGLKQQGLVTNPQSSVLLLESAASALGDLP